MVSVGSPLTILLALSLCPPLLGQAPRMSGPRFKAMPQSTGSQVILPIGEAPTNLEEPIVLHVVAPRPGSAPLTTGGLGFGYLRGVRYSPDGGDVWSVRLSLDLHGATVGAELSIPFQVTFRGGGGRDDCRNYTVLVTPSLFADVSPCRVSLSEDNPITAWRVKKVGAAWLPPRLEMPDPGLTLSMDGESSGGAISGVIRLNDFGGHAPGKRPVTTENRIILETVDGERDFLAIYITRWG